uniref:C-C motif chemokine 20b n=1 Tax=Semicossyphus pulcher TaxID=241346 RepID=UPI0037E8E427
MASGRVFLLCSLLVLTTFIGSTQSANCCVSYARRNIRRNMLLGYTIQTINKSCDINAVIFHVKGRFVCANPSASCTQKLMKYIDEKRKKEAQILRGETGNNTASA